MALFIKFYSRLRAFNAINVKYCFSSLAVSPSERNASNKERRILLAAAYKGLDAYGLNEGVCNHLSAIAPAQKTEEDIMLIIPHGLHWSEVTPSNLLGINRNNDVVEGEGEPEITALCIHRGIYDKRPDVKAVMHTHMPYATALTCLEDPRLHMIHQNCARFFGRISYTSYGGLGDRFEEGARLGDALGKNTVLFMGNHGVMTVADSVEVAFDDIYYLERAAMVQVLAYSTKRTLKELDETVIRLTATQINEALPSYARSHLNCIIRRLGQSNSEYSII